MRLTEVSEQVDETMEVVMQNVKSVVVPLDGEANSERAIPVAVAIARRLGVDVRLLTAVLTPDEHKFRLAQLQTVVDDLSGSDLSISAHVALTHDVAGPIEDAADPSTLVVMATSAKLGLHDGHMGSIAEKVVRNVRDPVLLVGPHADASLDVRRVVVPVDGSPAAEMALYPAAEWARMLDVPLWVVTVVSPDEQAAAAKAGVTAEHGYVKRLADRVGDDVDGEFEVLHGANPVDSLTDFLGEDALCVMTTTGKSGLRRLVMGSVATGVVRHARRPVVVVNSPV